MRKAYKNNMVTVSVVLLVVLFTYTAVSKLLAYATFQRQLLNQPLPDDLTHILAWSLPTIELVTAGLLLWKPLRYIGLWLAFGLMTMFTIYIALIIANTFQRVPCSCGGVLQNLSWKQHLIFNIVFWIMAGAGLWILDDNPER